MTWYTIQAGYAAYFANTVTLQAQTLDEALEKAIELANEDPGWKSVDHCGPTYIDACCIGKDADPWDYDASLPIPEKFTERGEPPLDTARRPSAGRCRGLRRHGAHPIRR